MASCVEACMTSLVAQTVKNLPAMHETWVWSLGLIPGSDPWIRKSPGEGHGYPLQYSCLEDSMNRGAWWARIHWGHKKLDTTEQPTFSLLWLIYLSISPTKIGALGRKDVVSLWMEQHLTHWRCFTFHSLLIRNERTWLEEAHLIQFWWY